MPDLPTGTVTFLFTDIEGSTRLLQHLGEARYAEVLAEHHRLLRTAFHQADGQEIDNPGDGFAVIFARASDAVSAAVAAQQALVACSWPEGVVLRVRMGLHTGEPTLTATGYVGLDVHRAARIKEAGHGGQILLSQTTRDLVEQELPAGVSLQELGSHQLKDLQRPEPLFQLVIPGLPDHFPPLRSLNIRPHNLPTQPTPLVGREPELAAVRALLKREEVRLVTLTGPGGTGKTRLGLQVAAELLESFADGVFFVELAPISDPALVGSTIAETLGLRETGAQSLWESAKVYLQRKQMLLVLDNFEQVLAAAPLVAELLAVSPQLKLLVTSRAVLHLRGEHQFSVPPLALPDPKQLPPLETLSQYAAVALFIQQAVAVKPGFTVTNENAPAVAEICHRLDGLPLAIELAAARVRLLPPQAILARLESCLKLLTRGSRDLPARQQTLRSAITWSYDLLDEPEKALFQRLSVFVGGCTLEAAEAVCHGKGDLRIDVLDGVASLVDKSLLRQEQTGVDETRVGMLETIREYARECATASGEEATFRRFHARYFLGLAEEMDRRMRSPDPHDWLVPLEGEHDNLRAALEWSYTQVAQDDTGLRLAGALYYYWISHTYLSEGRSWLERALAQHETGSSEGPDAGPVRSFEAARARALWAAGVLAWHQGDAATAWSRCEKSLALAREIGDHWIIAWSLITLGQIRRAEGKLPDARTLLEESQANFLTAGSRWGISCAVANLGIVAMAEGNYEESRSLHEETLAVYREVGDANGIVMQLLHLADIARLQGDDERAIVLYRECLSQCQEVRNQRIMAYALEGLAAVTSSRGEFERSAWLFGAAESLRELIQAPLPPADRAERERLQAALCAVMGEKVFEAAWAAGRSASPEQVVTGAVEAPI